MNEAQQFLSLSLQVMINNGFTPDKEDYEFCAKVENMVIPKEGFFGISAATGGLAGNAAFVAQCQLFSPLLMLTTNPLHCSA